MILFYAYLTYYVTEGPNWPTNHILDPSCQNNSWAALFYMNNVYDPEHEVGKPWNDLDSYPLFTGSPPSPHHEVSRDENALHMRERLNTESSTVT